MAAPLTINPGDDGATLALTTASGDTEAVALPSITPDADGFVCGRTVALGHAQAGGVAVLVTTAAVPIEAAEGATATSLVGTLTVYAADADGLPDFALSEPLTVCDFSGDTAFNPDAGTVLRLASGPLPSTIYEGQTALLVWSETGDLGTDGGDPETLGDRPAFTLLGWPLTVIEETSF